MWFISDGFYLLALVPGAQGHGEITPVEAPPSFNCWHRHQVCHPAFNRFSLVTNSHLQVTILREKSLLVREAGSKLKKITIEVIKMLNVAPPSETISIPVVDNSTKHKSLTV